MGDLLSDLPPPNAKGPRCTVGAVLDGFVPTGSTGLPLDDAERDQLRLILDDQSVTADRIAKLLQERRDLDVGQQAIQRHRRGACKCR